jgi:hypothetical protein
MMKAGIVAILAYILVFIATFGHAYNRVGSTFAGENALGAFISSIFWPLYWSVQIWS